MARIDVEKKQKSVWPWVAGLVVLVGLGWGITQLLAPPPEPEEPQPVAIEGANEPAAIPSPADEYGDLGDLTDPNRGLEEIAPLGEEDVGQTLRLSGEVVATGNRSFWIVAGSDVLMVDSERTVRKGDTVQVEGTLREADPEKTDEIASSVISRHPASGEWNVVRVLKLVEPGGPAGG